MASAVRRLVQLLLHSRRWSRSLGYAQRSLEGQASR